MENTDITQLLAEVRRGDLRAQSQLASAVYAELHRLAAHYMRAERPNHSLQATVLVNEAFMRLVAEGGRNWQNRAHFFAAAAQTMRHILIDYARQHKAGKRGGGQAPVVIDEFAAVSEENCEQWIAVDRALDRLEERDPKLAKLVELRFFAGLTEEEVGEILDISPRTVKRHWKVAKAWLYADLTGVPSR